MYGGFPPQSTNSDLFENFERFLLTLFYKGSGRYVVTWGGSNWPPPPAKSMEEAPNGLNHGHYVPCNI